MQPLQEKENNVRLSFGCAKVGGSVSVQKSLLALETAFENGVVQYDVARSYGFGSAEGVLGKFAKNKREQICITTKFGIEPPKSNLLLNLAKPLARSAVKYLPFLKKNIQQVAGGTLVRSKFTPEYASVCIEKSLNELQTDYIDLYLLHGCHYQDTLQDDLFSLLQDFVIQGKIRAFGVSSSGTEAINICENNRQNIHYFQFESSLLNNNSLKFNCNDEDIIFANAPFERGNVESYIIRQIEENPLVVEQFQNLFGVNINDSEQRNKLILQTALSSNPQGIVICTMLTPKHIKSNVDVCRQNNMTRIDVARVSQLLGISS